MSIGVYATLCGTCKHLSSRHGLIEGGDLRAGPYRCMDCGCEVPQDHPDIKMDKAQYEAWATQNPTLTWEYTRLLEEERLLEGGA